MANHGFLVHRPAYRYQAEYSLFNHFGIQANIIIAATYTNKKDGNLVLSKDLLYAALKQTAAKYPELGITNYYRDSTKKPGQHQCWSAFRPLINLDEHVKFIDIPAEEEATGLTATLQRYHSLYFDATLRPPWQLVVVNGKYLLFVFDHYLTDGRGGTYVLESILEALNSPNQDSPKQSNFNLPFVELTADIKGFPEMDPIKRAPAPLSLFTTILNYLRFDRPLDWNNPQREDNLVKTRLHTLRLDASTMEKCIRACRSHQTSFTSLLHTLIKVTLATDFYPDAKFNHSITVVDIRQFLKPHDREQTMENAASIVSSFDWLSKFRQAGEQTSSKENTKFEADLLWELARKHRAHILNDMNHKKTCLSAWQSVDLIGEDEEDYITGFIPGLKFVQRHSFSVSNLGAWRPNQSIGEDGNSGDWTITNMEFSAGALQTGFATDLVFNVAGVQDGPTTIHACHQEGALRDDFVDSVLERVKMQMDTII